MNLPYTYSLLKAASEQRHGFIKLTGDYADYEVRQMVASGLVEATVNDGKSGSYTSINRLLEPGERFLRVFNDGVLPELPSRSRN
jgi:hypothetical protein